MRRRRKIVLASLGFGVLVVAGLMIRGCTYYGESVDGQVVDAESSAPLAGVIVAANWELTGGENVLVGQLRVLETVTGPKGAFHFPAWTHVHWNPIVGLNENEPQLVLFKPGYKPLVLSNPANVALPLNRRLRSHWNGTVFRLEPISNPTPDYLSRLYLAMERSYIQSRTCDWQRVPLLLTAFVKEGDKFAAAGAPPPRYWGPYVTTDNIDNLAAAGMGHNCGSLREFLRRISS